MRPARGTLILGAIVLAVLTQLSIRSFSVGAGVLALALALVAAVHAGYMFDEAAGAYMGMLRVVRRVHP